MPLQVVLLRQAVAATHVSLGSSFPPALGLLRPAFLCRCKVLVFSEQNLAILKPPWPGLRRRYMVATAVTTF